MSKKTKFNILLVHLITCFVSIPALMIIGYFFPGEAAPGEVSWAVWASIGVGMAHVVSLFIFFCVLVRQDTFPQISLPTILQILIAALLKS